MALASGAASGMWVSSDGADAADLLKRAADLLGHPRTVAALKDKSSPVQLPTLKSTNLPGLPQGARAYHMTLEKKAKGDDKAETVDVFVTTFSLNENEYLLFSFDKELLVQKAQVLKAGPAKTLGSDAALAVLREGKYLRGGFARLSGIGRSVGTALAQKRGARRSFDWATVAKALTHKGEVPVVWGLVAEPGGPKITAKLFLSRAVLEDAVLLGTALGAR
jgi:hypothetical protein